MPPATQERRRQPRFQDGSRRGRNDGDQDEAPVRIEDLVELASGINAHVDDVVAEAANRIITANQSMVVAIQATEGVADIEPLVAAAPTRTRTRARSTTRTRGASTGSPVGQPKGRISAKEGIAQVLERAGGPMHTKEIAKRVLRLKSVGLGGETPEQTIAATLATENAKGPSGLFVRTAPGTYKLRARRGR